MNSAPFVLELFSCSGGMAEGFGKMSSAKCEAEIAAMRAVRATLAQLPSNPPAQAALFGAAR